MRPGFTALLEWGWTPYVKNDDSYITTTSTYNAFLTGKTPTGDNALQEIYKTLHVTKSLQEANGNYDALIGYIKNFQWSFRPDGGYDCSTTLISFGEVLESLKINYSVLNISAADKTKGFLGTGGTSLEFSSNFPKVYDKSKLSGLLYELSAYMATTLKDRTSDSNESVLGENNGIPFSNVSINGDSYDMFALDLKVEDKNASTSDKTNVIQLPSADQFQYYITLDSFCRLLNKYVLITSDKGNLVSLSTQNREYNSVGKSTTTTPAKTPIIYPLASNIQKTPQDIINESAAKGQGFPVIIRNPTGGFTNAVAPNPTTPRDYSKSLLCLTHPLQLSVDPSICLIKSPVWENGFSFPKVDENVTADTAGTVDRENGTGNQAYSSDAARIVQNIIDYGLDGGGDLFKNQIYNEIITYLSKPDQEKALQELVVQYESKRGKIQSRIYTTTAQGTTSTVFYGELTSKKGTPQITIKSISSVSIIEEVTGIKGFLSFGTFSKEADVDWPGIYNVLKLDDKTKENYNALINNGAFTNIAKTAEERAATNDASEAASTASKTNLKFLNKLLPFFKDDKTDSGLGYISNIYININYLYQLSLNQNLESLDKKEKNEINLYDYLKTTIGAVQASIGNVNNFDIHVDPIDNIGRIIDINFTSENPKDEYDKAVELKIQGTDTTALNVSLQSQIFPEQSSIVAISAQNGGGTLGLDNNTLVGFNRGIKDRILPEKFAPKSGITPPTDINTQLTNLRESIGYIASYITDLKSLYVDSWLANNIHSLYNTSNANEYKNALRDIINLIKAISNDPNRFKSIIPTKLSVTLDGIGGIVIGNIFRIPDNSLPAGYKGQNGVGRKLGYIVTGLSHKIDTKFWETTIDAQTIILEIPTDKTKFDYNNIVVPDLENPGGFKLQVPTPTNNVGANDYSNSPVAQYYQSKKYANGNIPDSELRYLKTDDVKSNAKDRLHPKAAAQWEALTSSARSAGYSIDKFNISYVNGAAYRLRSEQKAGVGRAEPGRSPHGWGGAVDIQQLVDAQRAAAGLPKTARAGLAAGAAPATKVRETSELYKWLAQNGPNYGWYNPSRLADGSGQDEAWHFEYWGPAQ
jgi:hypothetical protein